MPRASAARVWTPSDWTSAARIMRRSSASVAAVSAAGSASSAVDSSSVKREVRRADHVITREDHGPLDEVLELSHVPRVVVAEQQLPGRARQSGDRLPVRLGERPHEVVDQGRDVFPPLPERRDDDRHDVNAVVQVIPEPPRLHEDREVSVRRRDEPHVHGDRPAGADALELVLLEHREELDPRLPWASVSAV
jgi:hypothetical protein